MPQTMCQFYKDFMGAANTWQNGHFRPESFVYAVHQTQMEIFNANKKMLGTSQIAEDNLRYFFLKKQINIKDFPSGGLLEYPEQYSMFSSLRFYSKKIGGEGIACADLEVIDKDKTCRPLREEEKASAIDSSSLIENVIKKVGAAKWAAVNKHASKGPTLEVPYCTQNNEGFSVSPRGVGWVVLNYLSTPVRPVFKYHFDAKDYLICDEGGTDILWGDELLPDFMAGVKTKYASFVSDGQKYQEGAKETVDAGV